MKLSLFVTTLCLCVALASAGCKSGWQGSNELGACYKLYTERVPWLKGALNYCAKLDGNAATSMAEPRTQEQLDFIFSKFRGEMWMGITDTQKVRYCLNSFSNI